MFFSKNTKRDSPIRGMGRTIADEESSNGADNSKREVVSLATGGSATILQLLKARLNGFVHESLIGSALWLDLDQTTDRFCHSAA